LHEIHHDLIDDSNHFKALHLTRRTDGPTAYHDVLRAGHVELPKVLQGGLSTSQRLSRRISTLIIHASAS
jgi:hypothetical protein